MESMDGLPPKPDCDTENVGQGDTLEDLYAKLESQDNDLMLAAELGKVLLDKNEVISNERETIVLEYLQRLEVKMM